jgi:hypothetical protein
MVSDLELKVIKIQKRLIDARGNLTGYFKNETLKEYATELASHYFPRSKNETYLEPVIEAFLADLILAPITHTHPYLFKYNYSELDILANFFRFTNSTNKYFFATTGILPRASIDDFRAGLEHLHIQLDNAEQLFNTYLLEGRRAKLAARLIESIAYLEHDQQLNRSIRFMDNTDIREKAKREGKGKFRYLRRGYEWLALGTAPAEGTIDLRHHALETFDYCISVTKVKTHQKGKTDVKQEVRAVVGQTKVEQFKREIQDILYRDASIFFRLKIANEHYRKFYERYKHATSTKWKGTDQWLNRATDKAMHKANMKPGWSNFQAAELKPSIVFPPVRTNFFWNVREELNCDFKNIWSPYRW